MVSWKKIAGKMVSREKNSHEKKCPEKWSPEKWFGLLFLRSERSPIGNFRVRSNSRLVRSLGLFVFFGFVLLLSRSEQSERSPLGNFWVCSNSGFVHIFWISLLFFRGPFFWGFFFQGTIFRGPCFRGPFMRDSKIFHGRSQASRYFPTIGAIS